MTYESSGAVTNSSPPGDNSRLGLALFAVYTVFYASFVFVNAFAPQWADWIVFSGLNLAVVWGISLIVLAFVLAMIYGLMCTTEDTQ